MALDGQDISDDDAALARIDILRRELAVSRALTVRARDGLEASRLQSGRIRDELRLALDHAEGLEKHLSELQILAKALKAENAARGEALAEAGRQAAEAGRQAAELLAQFQAVEAELALLRGSFSWRLTRPVRFVARKVRAIKPALRRMSFGGGAARLRAMREYEAVRQSGLFDDAWYRQAYPDIVGAGVDSLRHYLTDGWREGRRPGPQFDPDYYRYANPDIAKAGLNPLAHYAVYGRKEGRDIRAVGGWRRPATGSTGRRETTPIFPAPAPDPASSPRIAVMIHAFYPDVFALYCDRLKQLPGRFTLLVSIPSAEARAAVEAAIADSGLNAEAEVRVTPNRGRNFGPLLSEFGDIIRQHDLLLHLHTKKSLHGHGQEQTEWREDILSGLVGGHVSDAVLNLFAERPEMGVVYTRTYPQLAYWANSWLQTAGLAPGLYARLGIGREFCNLRGYIDYPVGGMFWARVAAIAPLFETGFTYADFPEEGGQLDGALQHGIERCFADLAHARGYVFAEADPEANLFRIDWSDKNLERYELNTPERLAGQIDRADLVSFDLFDTLLLRPSLSPDAVQRYVGVLLTRDFPQAPAFYSGRKEAEQLARAAQGFAGDVGLDGIYERMAAAGWPADALQRARELEVEIERRIVLTRPSMVDALRRAKAAGKRVIAVSDTYFSQAEIGALLAAAGLDGLFDEVALSSERGARKDRGDLWKTLKAQPANKAAYWLHIGDNEVSDMQRAGDLGLSVFHAMNPITLLMQKGVLTASAVRAADEAHGWADALLLGPAAARLGADPFPVGGALGPSQVETAHDLGYCVYGPALFAFCAWLAAQPKVRALDRLYFLSREGWALQPIYDAIRAALGEGVLPPSHYLHVSRRTVLLAGQANGFDPAAIIDGPEFKGDLAGLLRGRFGFEISPDSGIDGAAPINLPADAEAVRSALETLRAPIEAQAEREAQALGAYLEQQGLTAQAHSGVVDIGYRATIQKGLQRALGRGLDGFYLATFPEAAAAAAPQADGAPGSAAGYFGDGIDPLGETPMIRHAILLESFMTAPQGQVDHFELGEDGVAAPVFLASSRGPEDREILAQLHAGALSFAQDMIRWFGPAVLDLPFDPAVALEPLIAFGRGRVTAPTSVLKALRVDDAFCGYEEHEVGLDLAIPPSPQLG